MPTTAGSTARGLPYPGDTGTSPDGPASFKALADAIEAMMNSPLVLGSALTALTTITAQGTGTSGLVLLSSSSGADLKRSRLLNDTGVTRLQSLTDAFAALKTGLTMDHATGVVDFPNGFTGRRVDSPYFRAYRSSAAGYASGAAVIFNTETADPNGWYDNATGIFLPTVAGTYRVSWAVMLGAALTVDKYWYTIASTSGGTGRSEGTLQHQRSTDLISSVGSDLLAFNGTTDDLRIVAGHNNGGSAAVNPGSAYVHFEAERIGT